MATSSIFTRVRIDNEKDAEAFVDALEKSEKAARGEQLTPTFQFVTDRNKILAFAAANEKKRKAAHR